MAASAQATSLVEKGCWMMKPKATKEGGSQSGGLKGLFGGGGWSKRFVWVQNKALCYGAKQGKAEKSIPLATWRVARPLSQEEVKKAKGPSDKLDCGWELLANDRKIQFTTDSLPLRDLFVQGMNGFINTQIGEVDDCDFDWDEQTTHGTFVSPDRETPRQTPRGTSSTTQHSSPTAGGGGGAPTSSSSPPSKTEEPNYDEELSDSEINMEFDDDGREGPPPLPPATPEGEEEISTQQMVVEETNAKEDTQETDVPVEAADAVKEEEYVEDKVSAEEKAASLRLEEFSLHRSTLETQESSSRQGHQGDEAASQQQLKKDATESLELAVQTTGERIHRTWLDERQNVGDEESNMRMMVIQEERGTSNELFSEALEGAEGASAAIMQREHDNERIEMEEAATAELGSIVAEERSEFPSLMNGEPYEKAAAKEATHQREEALFAQEKAEFEKSEQQPRSTVAKQEKNHFNNEILKKHKFEIAMVNQAVTSRLRMEAKQERSAVESNETVARLEVVDLQGADRSSLTEAEKVSRENAQVAEDSRLEQEQLVEDARRKQEEGDQLGALQDDETAARKHIESEQLTEFATPLEDEHSAIRGHQLLEAEELERKQQQRAEEAAAREERLKAEEAAVLAAAEVEAVAEAHLKKRQEELEKERVAESAHKKVVADQEEAAEAELQAERDAEEARRLRAEEDNRNNAITAAQEAVKQAHLLAELEREEEEAAELAREEEEEARQEQEHQVEAPGNQNKTLAAQAAEKEVRKRRKDKDAAVAQRNNEEAAGKAAPPVPTGPTPEQVRYDKEMANYEVAMANYEVKVRFYQEKQEQLKQYRGFITQGVWVHKPAASKAGSSGSFLSFGGGWKRRYLQLQAGKNTLQYCEGPNKAAKGTFTFSDIVSIDQLSGKQGAEQKAPSKYANFCFCIGTDDKNYNFACEQANDCRQFVMALTEVTMDFQKPSKPPVAPVKPTLKKSAAPTRAVASSSSQQTPNKKTGKETTGVDDDLSPHDPWEGEDEDEEGEWEVCLDVVEKGVWMHKPPTSSTTSGSSPRFFGAGWKRRYVWVHGQYLYYGETADTAKTEKRIALDTVSKATNVTVKEADALKAPEKFARSTWRLTSEGKNIVFACEKGIEREFFVNFFTLMVKRRGGPEHRQQKHLLPASARSESSWDQIPDSPTVVKEDEKARRASQGPNKEERANQHPSQAAGPVGGRRESVAAAAGPTPNKPTQESEPQQETTAATYDDDDDDDGSFKWSEDEKDPEETSDFDGGETYDKHSYAAPEEQHSKDAAPQSPTTTAATTKAATTTDRARERGGSTVKKLEDDESLLGEDRNTAIPLPTLASFVSLVVTVVRPVKEEGLTGCAVHDRDALVVTKCGDCDNSLVGKMTSLFHRSDAVEKFHSISAGVAQNTKESAQQRVTRGVKSNIISVQIETDKRTLTVGTMTGQHGDPYLMTTVVDV